jgi:hypothetical protein
MKIPYGFYRLFKIGYDLKYCTNNSFYPEVPCAKCPVPEAWNQLLTPIIFMLMIL